jgi:hypothetical protein
MREKPSSLIYRLFLWRGGQRINSIEQQIGFSGATDVSNDDKRNVESSYEELFGGDGRLGVERFYRSQIAALKGVQFDQCADVLAALAFLQEVVATALWKYGLDVGDSLDAFARGFDRLDLTEERRRLHELAQRENEG